MLSTSSHFYSLRRLLHGSFLSARETAARQVLPLRHRRSSSTLLPLLSVVQATSAHSVTSGTPWALMAAGFVGLPLALWLYKVRSSSLSSLDASIAKPSSFFIGTSVLHDDCLPASDHLHGLPSALRSDNREFHLPSRQNEDQCQPCSCPFSQKIDPADRLLRGIDLEEVEIESEKGVTLRGVELRKAGASLLSPDICLVYFQGVASPSLTHLSFSSSLIHLPFHRQPWIPHRPPTPLLPPSSLHHALSFRLP